MRQHKIELKLAVLPMLLMLVGLITMYTIGPAWAAYQSSITGTHFYAHTFFIKQGFTVVVTLILMYLAWLVFTRNRNLFNRILDVAPKFFLATLALCLVVGFLGGIGVHLGGLIMCSGGACRAIKLPFIGSFQPAELLKVSLTFYVINIIKKRKEEGNFDFNAPTLVPICTAILAIAVVVGLLEKDLGSTTVMGAMIVAMLLVANIKLNVQRVALALGIGVILMASLLFSPHRIARLNSFQNQISGSASAENSHSDNAILAIGSGGFKGVGIGNSVQATGYLPESINDSIFAVIGETTGFVGLVLLILAYAAFLTALINLNKRADKETEALVPIAVFAWIFGHTVINMAGMTGILPMKGITLPFISYGGSSMMCLGFMVGVVLYISSFAHRTEAGDTQSRRTFESRRRRTRVMIGGR